MKVVYNSFAGRYRDNPRAIYEALDARHDPMTHVWLADPARAHEFPATTATVAIGSAECVEALETADVVVSNTHIEFDWVKRPGASYLQTWHGTPLKHIHMDSLWASPATVHLHNQDVRRWDVLLSPNVASTVVLRTAFGFTGDVVETGYPRNDLLTAADRDDIRRRVRAQWGMPADVTAVLYAPTWRDDLLDHAGRHDFVLHLDLDDFTRRLGPNHVLLLRVHPLIAAELPRMDRPGVRDVSGYPDIGELYLAADVLVTDYSSTMFDFAVTGRPILLFAYDLAYYRDVLRGFYFDIVEHAPGPILYTSDQVVNALIDLDRVQARYRSAYRRFRDRFCHLEDGLATRRVLDRVFPSVSGPARRLRGSWRPARPQPSRRATTVTPQ